MEWKFLLVRGAANLVYCSVCGGSAGDGSSLRGELLFGLQTWSTAVGCSFALDDQSWLRRATRRASRCVGSVDTASDGY